MRAIGYLRVSTAEQGESGAGLDAQRATIDEYVDRHGWELVDVVEDVATGTTTERAGLASVLERLESQEEGRPEVLIVAKLDRLSRSVVDGGRLFERAHDNHWYIVAPDLSVDTSTANGRLMANIIMALGQWEAEVIGERTRDALAVRKAQGVRLGRPQRVPEDVVKRMKRWRSRGWSYPKIANRLNELGVPTAHGGREWYPATVRSVLERTRKRAPRPKQSSR